ncbi:PREDICTED: apoptosis regulator BAX isoform X2 [Mandrillus leucophaeus]|uniref:apoptosis regulator BAX isoform X2 n=1 Tax=Mandrillus leucophaeus TaxID=9568 RepID=UPI0005F39CF7|nr:PREDICTED: apoptosis regulator BAX isoform X2 [Mandrillus leucophaeus]
MAPRLALIGRRSLDSHVMGLSLPRERGRCGHVTRRRCGAAAILRGGHVRDARSVWLSRDPGRAAAARADPARGGGGSGGDGRVRGAAQRRGMIAAVDTDSPREVFFRVAADMFSDGNFNWGRVVALFYFASKLVLKALCTKVPELIRTIMGWTLDFLRERLLGWIQDQGGWDGLLSYFGTPTWQTVTILVAGVLTASLTIWKKMG